MIRPFQSPSHGTWWQHPLIPPFRHSSLIEQMTDGNGRSSDLHPVLHILDSRRLTIYIIMCDPWQAVFPKKCQWPFGACLSSKRRIDVYSSGTAQASHLIPFSSLRTHHKMTIAPMSARRGSEPIASAKVIISCELTKKSVQKVSFERKRADFASIFWQERRFIVFLQKIRS